MIKIYKPEVLIKNDKAVLWAKVFVPQKAALKYKEITKTLKKCAWRTDTNYPPKAWNNDEAVITFEVDKKYAEYLCTERSDAFVMAILWYAMAVGEDIEYTIPLSKKLYQGLVEKIIPAVCKNEYRTIKLIGPNSDEKLLCKGGVGLGMTCGIDSIYSLRTQDDVTHLAFYEYGHAFHLAGVLSNPTLEEYYKKAYEIADFHASNAAKTASESGKEFIYVKTNLDENLYRGGMMYRAMYSNLSCALALQKLFKTYISSSSGHEKDLETGLIVPTQNYESLICDNCKTETMDYISSDCDRRFKKIEKLCDDEIARKYLEVCFNFKGYNCGKCFGCLKTMVVLDLIGKLNNFDKVFDLKDYYENRVERIKILADGIKIPEMASLRESWVDIVNYAKTHKSELSTIILELDRNE